MIKVDGKKFLLDGVMRLKEKHKRNTEGIREERRRKRESKRKEIYKERKRKDSGTGKRELQGERKKVRKVTRK